MFVKGEGGLSCQAHSNSLRQALEFCKSIIERSIKQHLNSYDTSLPKVSGDLFQRRSCELSGPQAFVTCVAV